MSKTCRSRPQISEAVRVGADETLRVVAVNHSKINSLLVEGRPRDREATHRFLNGLVKLSPVLEDKNLSVHLKKSGNLITILSEILRFENALLALSFEGERAGQALAFDANSRSEQVVLPRTPIVELACFSNYLLYVFLESFLINRLDLLAVRLPFCVWEAVDVVEGDGHSLERL